MKKSKLNFVMLFVFIGLFFSCRKEQLYDTESNIIENSSDEILENVKLSFFAKSLVKTLSKNLEFREMLKRESLKQFDRDYDVLYQLIKDYPNTEGATFRENLLKNGISEDELISVEKDYPLLTIYVPELPNFSAESWDVNEEIPMVAQSISNEQLISLYGDDDSVLKLEPEQIPGFPVLVLKENERVYVSENSSPITGKVNSFQNKALKGNDYSYSFIDKAFNGVDNLNPKVKQMTNKISSNPDPAVKRAFNSGVDWHRDNIYYGLTPTATKGKFNNRYSEFITSFRFAGNAESAYRLIANQTGDSKYVPYYRSNNELPSARNWTEGHFEFRVTIKVNAKNGIGPEITKVFTAKGSDLFNLKYKKVFSSPFATDIYALESITTKQYNLNIELLPWDLENVGMGWKFSIYEHDPDQVITKTYENSTQYATNFSFEPGGNIKSKIGLKFGGSETISEKETYSVKTTLTSDYLGDATLTFDQPVIVRYSRGRYYLREISTGSVSMTIEPRASY